MLVSGDVIQVFDRRTDPRKIKRNICICPRRRLFLRINSKPYWQPHHRLLAAESRSFLDEDSFVELRMLLTFSNSELDEALRRPGNPLGRLSRDQAKGLAFAARKAETLTGEQQRLIQDCLTGGLA